MTLVSASWFNVTARTERVNPKGRAIVFLIGFTDEGGRWRRRWQNEKGRRNERGQLESPC